jgi:hypothetical protein
MTASPVLIASNRISGTSTSGIDWAVPNTYKHLWIVAATGDTFSSNFPNHSIRFNNNSDSNSYRWQQASFESSRSVAQYVNNYGGLGNAAQGTNYTKLSSIYVFDYNSTTAHKNWLVTGGLGYTSGYPGTVDIYGGRWANTAAVTSVQIFAQTAFTNGSLWQVYGLVG